MRAPRSSCVAVPSEGCQLYLLAFAEKEYEAALLKYLREQGKPVKLATLGSAVKRPTAVAKMKPFLSARPKAFKIDDNESTASLA